MAAIIMNSAACTLLCIILITETKYFTCTQYWHQRCLLHKDETKNEQRKKTNKKPLNKPISKQSRVCDRSLLWLCCTSYNKWSKYRATFKVVQMLVQKFVTGAKLTIVRPSDPLVEGHLNCSPVKNHITHNCSGIVKILL